MQNNKEAASHLHQDWAWRNTSPISYSMTNDIAFTFSQPSPNFLWCQVVEGEKGEQENRSPDEGAGWSKLQLKSISINQHQYSKWIIKIKGGKRRGPRTTIKAKQLEVAIVRIVDLKLWIIQNQIYYNLYQVLKTAFAQTPKPTRHIRLCSWYFILIN